jgi:hypothetical protein
MATGTVKWMTSSPPEQNAKMNRQRQGDRALEELAKQAFAFARTWLSSASCDWPGRPRSKATRP